MPTINTEPQTVTVSPLVFCNSQVELIFSSGLWTGLRFRNGSDKNVIVAAASTPFRLKTRSEMNSETVTNFGMPGVQSRQRDISGGGEFPLDGSSMRFISSREATVSGGQRLELDFAVSDYTFTAAYTLQDRMADINIEIALKYHGDKEIYLYEFAYNLPFFRLGPSGDENLLEIYDVRNNSVNLRRQLGSPVRDLLDGRIPGMEHRLTAMDNDLHHEISFLLHHTDRRETLFGWGYSPDYEAMCYSYEERSDSLSFAPHWWACSRLNKGTVIRCRRFILTHFTGEWDFMLEQVDSLKRLHDWQAPEVPDYLHGTMIYQIHGFIADGGGFTGWRKKLPELQKLGVGIIYLPPLASPEAYLNYQPDEVAACYGNEREFRDFVATAHQSDIRVIVDMIAHHLFRQSPAAQFPQFIRRDELGNPLSYSIGSVLTETRNLQYRKFYLDCCRNLVEKFDIDGFRFDVAGFQLPNWDRPNTAYERPGMGILGQTELLRTLKKELDPIKHLVYLEEGMGVNGFRYVTHGFIHYLKMLKNMTPGNTDKLAELVRRLRFIFADKILKERPGVITMYHTKIHDTALLQSFGLAIRGVDLAWTYLIFTIDGVPFITQGMERGYRTEIEKLADIRREYPEFRYGKMDFSRIHCDNPFVFCFIRRHKNAVSVVAINFSPVSQHGCLTLDFPYVRVDELFSSHGNHHVPQQQAIDMYLVPYGCSILKLDGEIPKKSATVKQLSVLAPFLQLTVSASTGLLQSDSALVQNHITMEQLPLPLIAGPDGQGQLDEGSFSGSDTGTVPLASYRFESTEWTTPEYCDNHWTQVFAPSTRLPYWSIGKSHQGRYVEDISPYELHALWSRSPRLRSGVAYFRKTFDCPEQPVIANISLIAPATYDFDLAVANGGVDSRMINATNHCEIWINGRRINGENSEWDFSPVAIDHLLRSGRNAIAVASNRGNGGHGIIAAIDLEYADGRHETIESDSSWRCHPGIIMTPCGKPAFDAFNQEFTFTLAAPDHDKMQKQNCRCRYQNLPDGSLAVTITRDRTAFASLLHWSITLEQMTDCRLTMPCVELTEKIDECGELRNSYSGARWPIFRTDEFSTSGDFSIELTGKQHRIKIVSATSGQIGIVGLDGKSARISLLSNRDLLRLIISQQQV